MLSRLVFSMLFLIPAFAHSQSKCDPVLEYAYDKKYSSSTNFEKYWLLRNVVTEDSTNFGGSFLAKIPVKGLPIPIDSSGSGYVNLKDSAKRFFEEEKISFSQKTDKQLLVNRDVIQAWSSCINKDIEALSATFDDGVIEIQWITPARTPSAISATVTNIAVSGDISIPKPFTGVLHNRTPKSFFVKRTGNNGGTVIIKTSDRGDFSLKVLPLMPSVCKLAPTVCWATPNPADTVMVYGESLAKDEYFTSKENALQRAEELGADHIFLTDHQVGSKQASFYKNGSLRSPCDGCTMGITYGLVRVKK